MILELLVKLFVYQKHCLDVVFLVHSSIGPTYTKFLAPPPLHLSINLILFLAPKACPPLYPYPESSSRYQKTRGSCPEKLD